jgi:choline dehydrogenase-like flavoprotein
VGTAKTHYLQNLISYTGNRKPRAIGVQFKDENGGHHQAFLKRKRGSDIIVSAGSIGSPQLLLLSGIGPSNELNKHNISVVLRNEHVGKGMSDNPLNSIFVPMKNPTKQSLIETVGITDAGVFIEASSGFSQSDDSIHCHHGIMSAEVWRLFFILHAYGFLTSYILPSIMMHDTKYFYAETTPNTIDLNIKKNSYLHFLMRDNFPTFPKLLFLNLKFMDAHDIKRTRNLITCIRKFIIFSK